MHRFASHIRSRPLASSMVAIAALATMIFQLWANSPERRGMTTQDTIEIIDQIIDSLRTNPGQFNIQVSVVGQQISSSGGIGLSVSAHGGGPGSTTVGQIVSVDGTQVSFAQRAASKAMDQQVLALIQTLTEIRTQLASGSPDKSKVRRLYESLRDTWVPSLITSILGNILTKSIGW